LAISFKDFVKNFLGNARAENYKRYVQKLLQRYKSLGCNTSIKLNFVRNFPESLDDVGDEQGE